jgi:hypothetical protein
MRPEIVMSLRNKSRTVLATALSACVLLAPLPFVEARAETLEPVGPKLTPRLKELLQKEMVEMLESATAITTALVTGDHDSVADNASRIFNGFIMKRSLTEKDKADLKRAVPPAFLQLDAAFHRTAEKLIAAAKSKDSQLEAFYFSKMLEMCMSCHTRYAFDRFPQLAK